MKTRKTDVRLIETDLFPFEFLSRLAERESWRKEIHRPLSHLHKWWATRLGSVFRGILLGCTLGEQADLAEEFYRTHSFANITVFDPFLGSGTTVGEAHKLGFTALGRDINPVALEGVRVAFGPMDWQKIKQAFTDLSGEVGEKIRALYRSTDSQSRPCDVLYYFWVMQTVCPDCRHAIDLFPSWVVARNAFPNRKPDVRLVCPGCRTIFRGLNSQTSISCPTCGKSFNPEEGIAKGTKATCQQCHRTFKILASIGGKRPNFRLFGKLVLTANGEKEYLTATSEDQRTYEACVRRLAQELASGSISLPTLALEDGFNTRQAMSYGFRSWRDFFNDRQLLALGWLQAAIVKIPDLLTRNVLLTLFSGLLEFNNLFASYKGEGTGAVRHMFSHHILKPERTPIEANVWGTPKSSGSFSTLFRSRLRRAVEYRLAPTEVNRHGHAKGVVCSLPFTGEVLPWPELGRFLPRAIYLSCGDSSVTNLPDRSIDLIITDPPFFDNVHYSELADFFYAWQQLSRGEKADKTTRRAAEVQDADVKSFAAKLRAVFSECKRVLKDDGLMVFTYHHSRNQGWEAVADAVLGAGFVVTNSQPLKSEMSVATPKSQAKEPIQLDIVLVCCKAGTAEDREPVSPRNALASARAKLGRLQAAGFKLSRNDRKIVLFGQMLATLRDGAASRTIVERVEDEFALLEESLGPASASRMSANTRPLSDWEPTLFDSLDPDLTDAGE
jgi:putative DNA methylase